MVKQITGKNFSTQEIFSTVDIKMKELSNQQQAAQTKKHRHINGHIKIYCPILK